jgi:hypothetical protein
VDKFKLIHQDNTERKKTSWLIRKGNILFLLILVVKTMSEKFFIRLKKFDGLHYL